MRASRKNGQVVRPAAARAAAGQKKASKQTSSRRKRTTLPVGARLLTLSRSHAQQHPASPCTSHFLHPAAAPPPLLLAALELQRHGDVAWVRADGRAHSLHRLHAPQQRSFPHVGQPPQQPHARALHSVPGGPPATHLSRHHQPHNLLPAPHGRAAVVFRTAVRDARRGDELVALRVTQGARSTRGVMMCQPSAVQRRCTVAGHVRRADAGASRGPPLTTWICPLRAALPSARISATLMSPDLVSCGRLRPESTR